MMSEDRWYFCLEHERAEQGTSGCRANRRLGPYPSREAAEDWRELAEERNERWAAEDRRWKGAGSE